MYTLTLLVCFIAATVILASATKGAEDLYYVHEDYQNDEESNSEFEDDVVSEEADSGEVDIQSDKDSGRKQAISKAQAVEFAKDAISAYMGGSK